MLSFTILRKLIPLLFLVLIVGACSGAAPSGTYVWIDVPRDGLEYSDLQPVNVEGHATGESAITHIDVFVDNSLWSTIEDPIVEDDLSRFQVEWLPPGYGTYTIQVVAHGEDGSESPADQTTISFGLKTPTPVITVTPVISITPTLTDTPTPLPGTEVEFWADPETIDAGACTDIRWRAENAQSVVFGGVEQPQEGSYQACLCSGETYSLFVVDSEGQETRYRVDVNVVGSCADTTPPPVPIQVVPNNGLAIGCKANQNMSWQPVSDESGISEYRVEVQRHSGDQNWSAVPGSVFSGISGKTLSVPVECGWTYRWRVQAVDGAGNVGSWSSWWKYVINLE
ncbi:MAG: Ig-like domain-containing protein [Anaerolineales bacterium]